MTITNGYLTLDEFKQTLDATTAAHDQRIEEAIEAASRQIDGFCRRRFYLDGAATPRVFYPGSLRDVHVDDIGDITGLIVKGDYGDDGTFEQTITNYQLLPLNGVRDGISWAYTTVRLVQALEWPATSQRAAVQVTAKWGWPAVPTAVKMACRLQSNRLFKGQQAPFGVIEIEDGLNARMPSMHPEVKALLAPYVRRQVYVA